MLLTYFTKFVTNFIKLSFLYMKFKGIFLFFFLISLSISNSFGQNKGNDSLLVFIINASYGLQLPGGDFADRFGINSSIGLGFDFITPRNYIIGTNHDFLFGSKIKEDVLSNLRTDNGQIIGNDQLLTNVFLRQRGLSSTFYFGKLIPISKTNRRSGIRITVGPGFLAHKLRLLDDNNTVTQIKGEYADGYDRLTWGFSVSEYIGYQYLSKNNRVNFFAGIEFVQGFTKNQRAYDFNTMQKDDKKRLDLIFNLKATWSLPFYINDYGEGVSY